MTERFADMTGRDKAERAWRTIVPAVDPTNGNERAAFLLFLESLDLEATQSCNVTLGRTRSDPSEPAVAVRRGWSPARTGRDVECRTKVPRQPASGLRYKSFGGHVGMRVSFRATPP